MILLEFQYDLDLFRSNFFRIHSFILIDGLYYTPRLIDIHLRLYAICEIVVNSNSQRREHDNQLSPLSKAKQILRVRVCRRFLYSNNTTTGNEIRDSAIEQTGLWIYEFDSTDCNSVEQLFPYTYKQVY